ncbi:hypothetical protein [Flavobacterium daemonense]|uniref:hypothetical protein n=1 Tax=Flavobacterium daemonense TaxID=1393049 RepID=UPI0011851F4E|nr:hypothetical protein [Flavobacterium daemonense]KAF2331978.1 hypothetical protein FND99_13155 [Flavobacterium daemonense]
MEIEEKDSHRDFVSLMNKIDFFTKLKTDQEKENSFVLEVKVSGYNELSIMIADLLKVSILALESDPPYVSELIRNPQINVLGILELALQLMPQREFELFDELHQFYISQKPDSIKES